MLVIFKNIVVNQAIYHKKNLHIVQTKLYRSKPGIGIGIWFALEWHRLEGSIYF